MNLIATFACAALGGGLGFYVAFAKNISNMMGLNSGPSIGKYTAVGAFLGAALGMGGGYAVPAVNDYMAKTGERAVINNCLQQVEQGKQVTLGKNDKGEVACKPL